MRPPAETLPLDLNSVATPGCRVSSKWKKRKLPQPKSAPASCNSYYFRTRRIRMKRVALLLLLAGGLAPLSSAQDHFQVGAYGDYFRLTQTNTNLAGLGVRAAVKEFPLVVVEGEMIYCLG